MNIDLLLEELIETVSFDEERDWRAMPELGEESEDDLRGLGGPGSGNFGHAGRPGEVGGSASASASGSAVVEIDPAKINTGIVEARAKDVADLMGFDVENIHVVNKDPRPFVVGNQQFHEAGHYDPSTNAIEINARNAYHPEMNVTYGIVAHEVSHAMWESANKARDAERKQINSLPNAEYDRLFQRNGFVRPEMQKEAHERWPVSAFFYKHTGDSYMETEAEHGVIGRQTRPLQKIEDLKKEDGISKYSAAYWEPKAVDSSGGIDRAINETLAEATRIEVVGKGVDPKFKPGVTERWRAFSRDLQKLAKTNPTMRNWLKYAP